MDVDVDLGHTDSGENNDGTFSFDDSDRFDEMSLCSWISEPEISCGNWRGWKRSISNAAATENNIPLKYTQPNVETLIELCSKLVAATVSFEVVEKTYPNLPEQLQLRIAFWSFPRNDDNIRLYSCLANGSAEEFQKGEQLYRAKAVNEPLQIGFHLSGKILPPTPSTWVAGNSSEHAQSYEPAVIFDRGHVTSCMCSCSPSAAWCCHIVALCLHRIHQPQSVSLRPPVSESLSRLQRNQLQKFSQYLISELPQQLLPYAQQLLDQLLVSNESSINTLPGAPDPTAGPSAEHKTQWWMDEKVLRDNVRKMLSKFCGPGPFVLEEIYNLQFASTAPPTAAEWSNLLRSLTGHEPEGMWNLLSIVRELFQHRDPNAVELLTFLTQECLSLEQIIAWWFCSRSQVSGRSHTFFSSNNNRNYRNNINTASTEMTKHACASFCDELVVLWRFACLDPTLTASGRQNLKEKLEEWHRKTVEKAKNARFLGERMYAFGRAVEHFPGFTMAIEACSLDWSCIHLDSQNGNHGIVYSPTRQDTVSRPGKTTRTSSHSSNDSIESLENTTIASVSEPKKSELVSTIVKVRLPIEDLDEDIDIFCTRTEALQVHGYPEASCAAASVAEKILAENGSVKEPKEKSGCIPEETDFFIKTTVVKAAFLCAVLSQQPSKHHLAFKIGIFGLQVPRKPAKSKALEVKLANRETELVDLLKKLPLGKAELAVVRERAELLCQGRLDRGKAVLPIKLAIFLFQVLVKSIEQSEEDKELGFKVALSALRMKADVLETEYPMLCEGTRRQRGELALALLDYAKDNPVCLQQVKECLLDEKRYRLEKHSRGQRKRNDKKKRKTRNKSVVEKRGGFGVPSARHTSNGDEDVSSAIPECKPSTSKATSETNSLKLSTSNTDSSESRQSSLSSCLSDESSLHDEFRVGHGADSGRDSDSDARKCNEAVNAGIVTEGQSSREKCSDGEVGSRGDHSPGEEWETGANQQSIDDYEAGWEESSGGPFGNKCDIKRFDRTEDQHADGDQTNVLQDNLENENEARFGKGKQGGRTNEETKGKKGRKKKGRSYHAHRSLEAEAHFTFELAKKALMLAGGATPSPSIFSQAEQANVTHSICNRSLQLCAFELGLCALGLHNTTCVNWLSRTYSAHVSWISVQALELGNVALTILLGQWEGNLTPSEVASIADRASKSNDQSTVQKAAQLALSCLHMAHTLNPGHIQRALTQCKEQSAELLESACLAIESAARGGGVYPEVLFEVAKLWEFLYEQTHPQENEEQQSNPAPRASHEPRVPHEQRAADETRGRSSSNPHQPTQPVVFRMARMGLGAHHGHGDYIVCVPFPSPEQMVQQQVSQQVQHLVESYQSSGAWGGQPQVAYQLASAYRVGMLALETLGRRTPDDQPNSALSKNSPCTADIHWLCSISNKVGTSSLQQFCRTSVNAIHSPFVLHDLALEAAGLMAKSNPSQIAFHLRSPSLSPLVQKCLMKFSQCVQQNLTNLPKSEYPEFVELIMHARGAYCMAPGGMTQFNDLLQSVRRSTSKKKDLWQKITTGLAQYQK